MSQPRTDRRIPRRSLILFGLLAAGVAAPILDLYGKNPSVFVANRSTPIQIVLFGLLVVFALPAVFVMILFAAEKVGRRAGDIAYYVLAGIASISTGLAISRQLVPDNTWGALAVAAVIAVVLMLIAWKIEQGLLYFAILGPAVLVMFLVVSPTSRLLAEPPQAADGPDHIGLAAPIVFIQLDELPLASLMNQDGEINADLFPNFARLAATGNWYRNALSNSISTTQSVPAILTGRLGDRDAGPSLVDHPDNLFTLLGDGYQMHVVEWLTDLCPEDLCKDYAGRGPARFGSLIADVGVVYGHLSLPESAREDLPSIDGSWKGFLGQAESREAAPVDIGDLQVPDAGQRSRWIDWMERVLDGMEPNAPPTLHFAHLEAPHIPWRINPSGAHYQRPEQYDEVDGVESGYWVTRPDLPRLGYQRHLFQLGFVDNRLGDLFEQMEKAGIWDTALVVVVAVHGASFVPGEHRRWPTKGNLADLYRIPLLMKLPGQETGRVFDEPAYAIDILPTIVDALDISTDWEFDGISLLDIEGTDRPHETIFYCCEPGSASTDIEELFDQVERNHEWVPDQTSWMAVAGAGPNAALVGEEVASLAPTADEGVQWSLSDASRLQSVDRATGFVQTYISGRLDLPPGYTGDDLLVAVNGVVAGTGLITRDSANGGEIHAVIAEDLVRDGANDVAILVPSPDGEGWVSGAAGDISVRYVDAEGRELEIVAEGNRRVEVTSVTPSEGGWVVTGWAADVKEKTTPDTIYLFADETLLVAGPPNKDNKDVVRWFKSETLLRSGFTFEIDGSGLPSGLERLTVVAKFGDQAVANPVTLPVTTAG